MIQAYKIATGGITGYYNLGTKLGIHPKAMCLHYLSEDKDKKLYYLGKVLGELKKRLGSSGVMAFTSMSSKELP